MATQKKGCGLLISALIILILGGAIAAFLGFSAANTSEEFADSIKGGEILFTPGSLSYKAKEDGEATVWIVGEEEADYSGIDIEVSDGTDTIKATKPSDSYHLGGVNLIGSFSVKAGSSYTVKATGAETGNIICVSTISSDAALSIVDKGLGAFGVFGAAGFIALILGIIGLVRFFSSKKTAPQAPPAA